MVSRNKRLSARADLIEMFVPSTMASAWIFVNHMLNCKVSKRFGIYHNIAGDTVETKCLLCFHSNWTDCRMDWKNYVWLLIL